MRTISRVPGIGNSFLCQVPHKRPPARHSFATELPDGQNNASHMRCRDVRSPFEEERDRNLKNMGNVLQPASADAIRSFFVFLHLPE
jgi:hypothetical protein